MSNKKTQDIRKKIKLIYAIYIASGLIAGLAVLPYLGAYLVAVGFSGTLVGLLSAYCLHIPIENRVEASHVRGQIVFWWGFVCIQVAIVLALLACIHIITGFHGGIVEHDLTVLKWLLYLSNLLVNVVWVIFMAVKRERLQKHLVFHSHEEELSSQEKIKK